MPLYDFECQKCKEIFEEIASSDCTSGETCPACGSTETVRMVSAPSPIPGSGTNRLPSTLARGGGAKFEKVPMPKRPIPKSKPNCPSGGCGSCSSN
ncbi:FmdB family zinc ribbon protein [Halodesulfovibrio spirochaetisodalis]|uniref:Putative regulatory protein FmdB zinc ribbon domain-containing protein n=1 Tax=Halodesulfovibrio spirochaetisodalis TaxID=1560234 RepID=A0A1B7X8U3_9BACT|nr:zinc ribbon domain-containing protein [Halodesulfovibrio spirochaetisodalis]OBQ45794.1 hypothetical protein SP90_15980 [Halodesulfovibrio spirochaetisodalis]